MERFGPEPFGLIFTDAKGDPKRPRAHVAEGGDLGRGRGVHTALAAPLRRVGTHRDQGASVKAVQRHLGHGSATTTLDTYAHLFPDSADVTRRALDAGLAAIVSPSCHDGIAEA